MTDIAQAISLSSIAAFA